MNENISYDTLLSLLVGDLRSEDDLEVVLNFLGHVKTVIRQLYWAQKGKKELLITKNIE